MRPQTLSHVGEIVWMKHQRWHPDMVDNVVIWMVEDFAESKVVHTKVHAEAHERLHG